MTLYSMIQNYQLSGAKLLIFAYISEREELKCSLREFSEDIGISINTLKKHLEELEEQKLISIKSGESNRTPSVYSVRKKKLVKKGQTL